VRGPLALQLKLGHPYAPFLATLAIPPLRVVPREEVEARGVGFTRHPVGSGPFKVADWTPENVLVLEPHDTYPGGRPYLDRIEAHLGSTDDEVAPFLRGEIDRAFIGRDDQKRLPPGTPVIQRLELGTTCLGLNVGFKVFGDPRVRRAAALALDREEIVRATGRIAVASRGSATRPRRGGCWPKPDT
jgi:peptide/nickel transport system substrate-binding protein